MKKILSVIIYIFLLTNNAFAVTLYEALNDTLESVKKTVLETGL